MSEDPLPDLTRIYETHYGKVWSYAARLLGRDDADDVAQEVFIKIGRSLDSLEDPSRLTPWIYAITLNTVRDAARKRSSSPDRFADGRRDAAADSDADSMVSHIPDARARTPEETAARNEMIACYLDYVRQLPAPYYEVYVLGEFEHLSNEEIARRLALPLSTAKMRLHRARAMLNTELRKNCRCYYNERGEIMGEPKPK